MPSLFPPISFLRTHTLEGPYFSEPKVSFNQASLFPAITPEKFGRQLKTIRLPFGNKGLFSSMLDIQLVDSFFPSDPNPSTSERAGLHFPSAFFGEITLMWLRHNMCFFPRQSNKLIRIASCKMQDAYLQMAKKRKPPFFVATSQA